MMVGSSATGLSLAGVMSTAFVNISNQHTFPLFTFLSAGLGAKDVMGFCIVDLLYSGIIISLGFFFF